MPTAECAVTYDSPKQISLFLKDKGLTLKKRFGQNFLVSPGARRKILSLLEPLPGETLWEIGPGIGSMTHMLVGNVEKLFAFEIDHGLIRVLEESLGNVSTLVVVAGDYLKTWRRTSELHGLPDAVVGNLPYNAAAPIIASLTEWEAPVRRAVFTVQREVARRMAASPRTKDYSSFSLTCQARFDVQLHGDIAPASFYPVPEVTSTIVRLVPNTRDRSCDPGLFAEVVRILFAARRKTIRNNLLSERNGELYSRGIVETALREAEIDPTARGEELSVDEVVGLVVALERARRGKAI